MTHTTLHSLAAAVFITCLSGASLADTTSFKYAGAGWLLTNDVLGDGEDRWETSSTAISAAYLIGTDDLETNRPFQVIELRHTTRLVSPGWLGWTRFIDRPLGAAQSLGLHTHFNTGLIDWTAGADLVFLGEQTGLVDLQDSIHVALDFDRATDFVLDTQIENEVRLAGKVEIGLPYEVDQHLKIRPFLEFSAGVETYGRMGVDLVLGSFGRSGLLAREEVSGFQYAVTAQEQTGLSLIAGADYTYIDESAFFPDEFEDVMENELTRMRLGLAYSRGKHAFFFGNTWLSEQIKDAPEAQRIGSINYTYKF